MFSILKSLPIHFKVVEWGDITLLLIVVKFCNLQYKPWFIPAEITFCLDNISWLYRAHHADELQQKLIQLPPVCLLAPHSVNFYLKY